MSEDRLLTESEAALRLGVSVACLRKRRVRKQEPKYLKPLGRAVRYEAAEIERILKSSAPA